MSEHAIRELTKALMDQHLAVVNNILSKHHERERWVANDCTYTHAGPAVPESVTKYSSAFLEGVAKIVSAIPKA